MDNNALLTHEETLLIESALGNPDGVIAFPTDTVYGLGCIIGNQEAVEKIYKIKNRDGNKPLSLLGVSFESLEKYVKFVPDLAEELMEKFWPGGLTIVLPKSRHVPDYVTSGLDSVGLRIPANPVFLEMLKRCVPDMALATTSANLSTQPDLLTYEAVSALLSDNVDYILEEHDIMLSGKASTVVTITKDNHLRVLRQGDVDVSAYIG